MDLSNYPFNNSAETVLFLGAGFSNGAVNICGKNVPTGDQFKAQLANLLEVDSTLHDFQTLADEVHSLEGVSLYQMLYKLFTVKDVQPAQVDILQNQWRRIYTTNYDDAVECYYHKVGRRVRSFSYSDKRPSKFPFGSIVHLHGLIRQTDEKNVLQQLILNESSYARQHFEKSLWYDEFTRDLRHCRACVFLGYSLRDYHISSILLQDPNIRKKTYFITSEQVDQIFVNRVTKYGIVLPIGVQAFAAHCRALPSPETITNVHSVKSLSFIDPFKDKKSLSRPTALEILNLVTYGAFNEQRCLSTLPRNEYVVSRQALAEEGVRQLENARTLIVHSLLGNGKSIFLYILANKLSEMGYRCFLANTDPTVQPEDLHVLKSGHKAVIMFDAYNAAAELINEFNERLPEAKFVVAVRTSIQEVRFHEIQDRFPGPIDRLNVNRMTRTDRRHFRTLLDRSGVRSTRLDEAIDNCRDVREIVTTLYDHEEIRQKIAAELEPLLLDDEVKRVFVASHLLKWAGHRVEAGFLRSVTGSDAYAVIAKHRSTTGDIFRLGDDNVDVRSSVFSEYLIQNHLSTNDVIDGVYPIIVEAVKRKSERRYQGILSSLMRFSILNRALVKAPQKFEVLIGLFERLRRDVDVNKEPLFWLQYAILMTAADKLDIAEEFIRTAYARAAENPGFLTFQIDTFALRLFLLIEQADGESSTVSRFHEIIEKMTKVRSMVAEESNRDQAVQVLEGVEPFIANRGEMLSVSEKNTLMYHLALIRTDLEYLVPADDTQRCIARVLDSIIRARNLLLQ